MLSKNTKDTCFKDKDTEDELYIFLIDDIQHI